MARNPLWDEFLTSNVQGRKGNSLFWISKKLRQRVVKRWKISIGLSWSCNILNKLKLLNKIVMIHLGISDSGFGSYKLYFRIFSFFFFSYKKFMIRKEDNCEETHLILISSNETVEWFTRICVRSIMWCKVKWIWNMVNYVSR